MKTSLALACLLCGFSASAQFPTFSKTYDLATANTDGLHIQPGPNNGLLCAAETDDLTSPIDQKQLMLFGLEPNGTLDWQADGFTFPFVFTHSKFHALPTGQMRVLDVNRLLYVYDADGSLSDQRDLSAQLAEIPKVFTSCSDGGLFTGDMVYDVLSEQHIHAAKFSAVGVQEWSLQLGFPGNEGLQDILPADDGGALIIGFSYGLGAPLFAGGAIYRVDATGNLLWTDTLASLPGFLPGSGVQLADGSWVLSGGTIDNSGGSVFTMAAIGTSGNVLWSEQHPSIDDGSELALTADGQLAVAGIDDPAGNHDLFVAKFSITGQLLWKSVFLPADVPETYGKMTPLPDNGFAIIGSTNNGVLNVPVVIRTNSSGQLEPVNVPETELNTNYALYPNPVANGVSVSVTVPNAALVTLSDLTGKQISAQTATMDRVSVSTANLSAGIYLVAVTANEQRFTHRLVVQ